MQNDDNLFPKEGYALMAAAFEVHNEFGGGLLEDIYQESLALELGDRGLPFVPKSELLIYCKGRLLKKRCDCLSRPVVLARGLASPPANFRSASGALPQPLSCSLSNSPPSMDTNGEGSDEASPAPSSARRMNSATTSSATASTFTIFTPRGCTCWASITSASPTNSKAAATGSPTWKARS